MCCVAFAIVVDVHLMACRSSLNAVIARRAGWAAARAQLSSLRRDMCLHAQMMRRGPMNDRHTARGTMIGRRELARAYTPASPLSLRGGARL
jgi:hypothetical protein